MGVGSPDQWHVIADGYELGLLSASCLAPDEARRRLGLPARGPVVGIVARLVAIKDHDTFLAAAAEVARAQPQTSFVIAGDGPERGRVEAKAQAVLDGRVRFLGWVTDIEALYRSLDVIVLTSRNEGTPAVLIEAGAASIPAVATDVGGVSDVVVDGETGFLVPPGDVRGVAGRVVELLRSPGLRWRLGERAREHVIARYDAGASAAAHAELYHHLRRRREQHFTVRKTFRAR
jgi:glycosyltransferase involved in cell wall biosynthesis